MRLCVAIGLLASMSTLASHATGWAETSGGAVHAFLYAGGVMTDLGPPGSPSSVGYAVNDRGEVTGEYYPSANSFLRAFLYSNGNFVALGTLGGIASVGRGINATGQVTGFAFTADGNSHAFLYSAGRMLDLGTLGEPAAVGQASMRVDRWLEQPRSRAMRKTACSCTRAAE